MSLGFAVVQLDVSVVNVAIRAIDDSLGGGIAGVQWVISAYTVVFAALILSAGALGDRIGAKRVFVVGFALFGGASAACGLAPSLGLLIAARALQGVGAAVLVPCSLVLLSHAYPQPADRARAVGLWAAGASVGLSAGPLVGGALIATLGWRAIFINLPAGAVGIALTAHWMQDNRSMRALSAGTASRRFGGRRGWWPGHRARVVAPSAALQGWGGLWRGLAWLYGWVDGPDLLRGAGSASRHGARAHSCLHCASDIFAPFEMAVPRLSLPTERHFSIRVDADNKPLLRAHDHDVLR